MSLSDKPFGRIPIDVLENAWPTLEPYIDRAIDAVPLHDDTATDVFNDAMYDRAQIWAYGDPSDFDLVVVTYLKKYKRIGLVCEVTYASGRDLEICKYVCERLKQWSDSIGCDKFLVYGRVGWSRVLKSVGLKQVFAICEG